MSKLQLNRIANTANTRHTVTVELPFDDGAEKMRVVYRGMSIREWNELQKKFENIDLNDALPQLLAIQIVELPDLVNGEAPVEPSVEFFETLDTYVLHRISKAIREDRLAVNPTMQ